MGNWHKSIPYTKEPNNQFLELDLSQMQRFHKNYNRGAPQNDTETKKQNMGYDCFEQTE